MKGNEMRPFFSSGGGVGATMEAARGRPAAAPCLASVREEEDDGWLGRDGGLGHWEAEAQWKGEEKSAGWKKKNGSWLGETAEWAES
jgi:hypothetical protein